MKNVFLVVDHQFKPLLRFRPLNWISVILVRAGQQLRAENFPGVTLSHHYHNFSLDRILQKAIYCAIAVKNAKLSKKSKMCSITFLCLLFLHIMSKFQLKSIKTHGGDRKMCFWEKCIFVKNGNFSRKNGQNFAEFGENFDFLRFCIILFMVPTISVIFSIIGIVLVKLWPKKYKNQLILGPKFPNKSKKLTNFSGPFPTIVVIFSIIGTILVRTMTQKVQKLAHFRPQIS